MAQAHRTVPLLLAPMAVLSVFVLWLVLTAATSARRGEVAVARLRGRSPAGAVGLLLLELLPALLVGIVPGALVALAGGAVVGRLLPGDAPLEVGPGFAAAVLLAVVAVVLTTVAAAVRTAREPLHDVVRSGPVATSRWALGAVDAFVVAAVGTGVAAFVSGSLQGPLALAGPALLALLAGLLLAHAAAPVGRASGRRLLRRGRLVAGTSLLETGRRPETRTVVVVLTVACALAVFAMDALAIGERNRSNASRHEAGAPLVLQVGGGDLDGVRSALAAVDSTGRRTTPVLVGRDTVAVEPEAFRRIAFFPRGAPTSEEWQALAPPAQPTRRADGFARQRGREHRRRLLRGRHLRQRGRRAAEPRGHLRHGRTPVGEPRLPACSRHVRAAVGSRRGLCRWVPAGGAAAHHGPGRDDRRLDRARRPARRRSHGRGWFVGVGLEHDRGRGHPHPARRRGGRAVGFELDASGFYPIEVAPAWVPSAVPALLTDRRSDPAGEPLAVTGADGVARAAEEVGRLTLLPGMPDDSALVDLDALTRGAAISRDSHVEVWIDDDPDLEGAVRSALGERDLALTDVRRYSAIRETYDDSVSRWSLALGAAVAPAVMLLALLVLLVLAVIGWRDARPSTWPSCASTAPRTATRRVAVWAQLPSVLLARRRWCSRWGARRSVGDARRPVLRQVSRRSRSSTQRPHGPLSWRSPRPAWSCCPPPQHWGGRAVARRAHLERATEAA